MLACLLTLSLLLGAGCGASSAVRTGPAEPPGDRRPGAVRAGTHSADPLPERLEGRPGRCVVACGHLAALTRTDEPGGEVAAWRAACVERCTAHASDGQLDCYERVVRPADIDACAVD